MRKKITLWFLESEISLQDMIMSNSTALSSILENIFASGSDVGEKLLEPLITQQVCLNALVCLNILFI